MNEPNKDQEFVEDAFASELEWDREGDNYGAEMPQERIFDADLVKPASEAMFPAINDRRILNKDFTVSNLSPHEMRWIEMVQDALGSCEGNRRLSKILVRYIQQSAFKANIVVSKHGFGRRQLKTVETKRSYALEEKRAEKKRWF